MVSKNHERLKECVDVAELLANRNKVVEDDTCLERILSAVEAILNASLEVESDEVDAAGFMAVFEHPCSSILNEPNKYPSSSVNYLLKLRALFLTHMKGFTLHQWKKEIVFLVCFSDLKCKHEDGNEMDRSKWFSASIQSSWISAIVTLISNPDSLLEIACHLSPNSLVSLAESRSIFVRKQACNCTAKYAINLKKLPFSNGVNLEHETMDRLQSTIEEIGRVIMNRCAVKDCMEMCKDMLILDHFNATEVLSSLSFVTYVCCNEETFLNACKKAEPWFAHFVCALYDEPMRKCLTSDCIMPGTMAFEFATAALVNNPTKSVGWDMLTSVLLYDCDLPTRVHESGQEMAVVPLTILFSNLKSSVDTDVVNKWLSVLSSLLDNREKFSSTLCHCCQTVAKLWKSGLYDWKGLEIQLLDILGSVAREALLDGDRSHGLNVHFVKENWKVARSVLNVTETCFDKFSSSELVKRFQNVLIPLFSSPDSDHSVVLKCNNLVLKLITVSPNFEFLKQYLASCDRKLIDRRWEVRDTTLEFLAKILSEVSVTSRVLVDQLAKIFVECNIPSDVLTLVRDSNSYVRSSALELTKILVTKFEIFDKKMHCDIFPLTINVALKEREALPRRSAVQCLHACLEKSDSTVESLLPALHAASGTGCMTSNHNPALPNSHLPHLLPSVINHVLYEDLDWEVKFKAIDILEYLLTFSHKMNNAKNPTAAKASKIHHTGMRNLTHMLTRMLDDCDKAVREKAHKLCCNLNSSGVVSLDADMLLVANQNGFGNGMEQTLIDLDDLLEEILSALRKEKQVRLTHGCHGPSMDVSEHDFIDDSVTLDCY